MGEAADSPPRPGAGGRQAGCGGGARGFPSGTRGPGGPPGCTEVAVGWAGSRCTIWREGGQRGWKRGENGSGGCPQGACPLAAVTKQTRVTLRGVRVESREERLRARCGRGLVCSLLHLPRPTAGPRGLSAARSSSRPPREVTGPKRGPKASSEVTRWRPGRVEPTSGHLEELMAAGTPSLLV